MESDSQQPNAVTKPAGNGDGETIASTHNASHASAELALVPVHSAPGTGKRIAVAAIVVLVALALIFVWGLITRHHSEHEVALQAQEASDAPPTVEVAEVHRATPRKILTLPGDALAWNETTIYARTNGYIKSWLVDIGDRVKHGQTLAVIDTPELDDQLIAARAKVTQSKSEAALAAAAANFAKVTYERWQAAAPEGVVSEQERDEKKAALDTGNAKVAAAQAEIAVDEAEVHRLETLVSFKTVTAPFDGTITQRHIDIGDLVTAGSTSSTTPLFTIAGSDQLRVFVDVPQAATPEIKDGMSALVMAGEHPNHQFKGTVDRMGEYINQSSRTMQVEVVVPNPELLLRPGDYVQVTFQTDRRNPPLEIPASALAMKPQGPEVAVVDSDGKVTFHKIQIAQDMGSYIEVASGLEDGDRVALNISSEVSDGDRIDVREASDQHTAQTPPATPPGSADADKHIAMISQKSTTLASPIAGH